MFEPSEGVWETSRAGRLPRDLQGRILETFSNSHESKGGPGAEGTGVGGGDRVLLGPGGEDYRRGEQHLSTSWLSS